jgi:hypothetical protein
VLRKFEKKKRLELGYASPTLVKIGENGENFAKTPASVRFWLPDEGIVPSVDNMHYTMLCSFHTLAAN